MRKKKNVQVHSSYELNRLAAHNLSDTYEKLFPTIRQKIIPNKHMQNPTTKQNYSKNKSRDEIKKQWHPLLMNKKERV
jgi:hypothetical protein